MPSTSMYLALGMLVPLVLVSMVRMFQFIGEHNGRPVSQKNSTKEYLYYSTKGTEWLEGSDFKTAHGGKRSIISNNYFIHVYPSIQ